MEKTRYVMWKQLVGSRTLARVLHRLQDGNAAPVGSVQMAMGAGMSVFASHSKAADVDGDGVSVREGLDLINHASDEVRQGKNEIWPVFGRCSD